MLKRLAVNALLVCLSVALALALLEGFARLTGEYDADGNFRVFGYTLHPYAAPVSQLRIHIDDYLAHEEYATVIHDDRLGWTYRANWQWTEGEGPFTTNSIGIRATREYSPQPPSDTLRIAAFGDSFTAGMEVGDKQAWTQLLEDGLGEAGIRAEVMNFGVGAYGMGQAYLRWQHEGAAYQPDIVIFGLQPENLKRNLNVFRQLLHAPGIPFSKPRFALQDGKLALLNSPAIAPDQLIAVFSDFASHPLASWEYHYQSRRAAGQWWNASRLLGLLQAALAQPDDDPGIYARDSEGGMLGQAILAAFANDVRADGSEFIVLHLPLRSHLIRRIEGGQPPYKFLLDYARESYHYIAMEEYLRREHALRENWGPGAHYGPPITRIVGETVSDYIAGCVRGLSCRLSRLSDPSALYLSR